MLKDIFIIFYKRLNNCISDFSRLLKYGLHTAETRFSVPLEEIQTKTENNVKGSSLTKENILEASLSFIPDHGWTHKSIGYGAESLGLPSVAHGMFPNGGIELLYYFYRKCNRQLNNLIQKDQHPINMNIFEFIQFAVKERLLMNAPYLPRWSEALSLMALPHNVPNSLLCLLSLVDDICYHAGDRSVDFNWYTRRLALAGIYQSTELYMIQDTSLLNKSTWEFLQRRVKDAEYLKNYLEITKTNIEKTSDNANATFLTARNLLNLNQ